MQELHEDEGYYEGQIGKHILVYDEHFPDLESADVILLGVRENRGGASGGHVTEAANLIRKHFYQLHYWHKDTVIADIGNVKIGASLSDSYAAIQSEIAEWTGNGKKVVILGGSHDIATAQYNAYKHRQEIIEIANIDAFIDLSESPVPEKNFLMDIFTSEPNYVKHYNHIAFQSYFVHPGMLETIDKLRFDCFRAGNVKENMEEMEPIFRSSNALFFDVKAIKYSDAPANKMCPNGLTGVESCQLARFAGMSPLLNSFGLYGYDPKADVDELTARQLSQILWYYLEGVHKAKQEAPISDRASYNEFHTAFGEIETTFLQNKRTLRWWMQMPDKKFIPCTYKDFALASRGDIPERWFRVQERSL